jgi:pilus assembly protein Flp/PilA
MIKTLLSKFWNEEDGASAIEYGLLAALIAVVIAGSVGSLGGDLNTVFAEVAGKLVKQTQP